MPQDKSILKKATHNSLENPLQTYLPRKVRARPTSVDVTVTRDVIDRFFMDVIVPDRICFQVSMQRNTQHHPETETNGDSDSHTLTSV